MVEQDEPPLVAALPVVAQVELLLAERVEQGE
jgi:hypothetical protein